ncbi:MAG: VOC family protein [Phenylobacterium sp.]|uniref:VOC family protein n=1 Tax=Phenylobacterium sp. TaxID=1871053 RepID=UPI001A5C37E3|nr:VOC family protein [Phenylobacterium sp.]MBL8771197.1 VOC family protein [Phenylobacterium sp.]
MIKPIALAAALLFAAPCAQAQTSPTANLQQVRVRYIVVDVARTVAFYRDKLGFRLDMQAGPYFAALSKGGVQLLISPATGPGGASQPMPNGDKPAPGGWNRLVLYTPDLEAEVARLRKDGVRFRNDIVVGAGGNEILLDDPSGNVVELFQPTISVATP